MIEFANLGDAVLKQALILKEHKCELAKSSCQVAKSFLVKLDEGQVARIDLTLRHDNIKKTMKGWVVIAPADSILAYTVKTALLRIDGISKFSINGMPWARDTHIL